MPDPLAPFDPTREAVELLERLSGQIIPPYRWPLVEAELAAFGRRHGSAGGARRLRSGDPEVRDALFEALSVPETYLFRHVGHFELLERMARRRAEAGLATRVLCAGCSTGEEAWSAAAVLDAVPVAAGREHRVVGWDLCAERLERAARGRFSTWTARRGLYRWSTAFEPVDGALTVAPRVRRMVRFAVVNLVTGPLPAEPVFDVVLFRNVAIYFSDRVAREAAGRLAGLTAADGLVMVGASDPVTLDAAGWRQRIEGGVRWFERREVSAAETACQSADPPLTAAPERLTVRRGLPSRPPAEAGAPSLEAAPPRPGPAQSPSDPPPELRGMILERVKELANRGSYREGLELLRQDGLAETVDGKLWQGILLMALENDVEAVKMLRQCVFLRPEDAEARRWLAAAYESLGEEVAAARERRNAHQLEAP